jgi:hypothetical protein
VLRDLWLQLRWSGFLAAEWLQECRVAHVPPVQLFLVTNLLFYLAANASHCSAFETKLKYHFGTNNVCSHFAYMALLMLGLLFLSLLAKTAS